MKPRRTIDRGRLPLNALRAFEAVGQHLSFTAGANALRVTQSALSRHVGLLEAVLDCKLVERRPNCLELTPAGKAILPVITQSFDCLESVLNQTITGSAPPERILRVRMPECFLKYAAMPILRDFRANFPDVPIDVSSTPRDAPRDSGDLTIVLDRPSSDMPGRELLWMVALAPLCSPQTASARGRDSLGDFLAESDLLHVRANGEDRGTHWDRFAIETGTTVDTTSGLTFDGISQAAEYALTGSGVLLGDVTMFADWISDGRLVQPFATSVGNGMGYFIEGLPDRLDVPGLTLCRTWIVHRLMTRSRRSEARGAQIVAVASREA